jgi:hypothetical protein
MDVKRNGARGWLKREGGIMNRGQETYLTRTLHEVWQGTRFKKTHHAVATKYRGRVIPWWKGAHLKTDAKSHGARDPLKEIVRYEAVTRDPLHRDASSSGDKGSNQHGISKKVIRGENSNFCWTGDCLKSQPRHRH